MDQVNMSLLASQGIFFPDGIDNFVNESPNNTYYKLELTNNGASAVDRVLCICPGPYTTIAQLNSLGLGVSVDAIISDGDIIDTADKKVTGVGEPGSVLSWLKDFGNYPTRITDITFEVNITTQLQQVLKTFRDTPYVQNLIPGQQYNPSTRKLNTNFNDKLITIPMNHLQFDNQTIVIYTLKAGATVTLTFGIGGRFDQAKFLDNEAKKSWSTYGIANRSQMSK